jgi:hypothetical protein
MLYIALFFFFTNHKNNLEFQEILHLLVCDWLHSVWQNHFYVMLLHDQGYGFYSESTLQLWASRRFYAEFKTVKLNTLHPSEQHCITSRHPSISNICPEDVVIPSGFPSVSRRFELFRVASVPTSQQHFQALFSIR